MIDDLSPSWLTSVRNSTAVRLVREVSEERSKFSVRLINLVLLPGVIARVGMRQCVALLLRVRVLHFGFSKAPGGHVVVGDSTPSWKRFLVVLGAPLILLPLGALIVSQLVVDSTTLQSFVPLPSSLDTDGFSAAAMDALARFDTVDLFRIWCAVSCWYMLIVPHMDVMSVLAGSNHALDAERRSAPWFLRPVVVLSWIGSKAGPAAGAIVVLLSLWLTAAFVRFLVTWRLGP